MNNRFSIANLILLKLQDLKDSLCSDFIKNKATIGNFYIDNLLPTDLVNDIYANFPTLEKAKKKKNIKEYKYVAYQMNKFNPLLEEVIYAFQDERVVQMIATITGIKNLYPDEHLYAGGLSMMMKGNFLQPHLDNSHDKDKHRWRVLNLLFYVTPDWEFDNGGNLELWKEGVEGTPSVIVSKFNRLVVMETHQNSWHSVSKVTVDKTRCCVSNYYFSNEALKESDSFHVTTFKARPEERRKNLLIQLDNLLRTSLQKIVKKGIIKNPHRYKKN